MSGGGGGAAVVQQVNPQAALMAGLMQSNAANEAATFANTQINNAIASLQSNYATAAQNFRPYTQEGIQALNQLNQYIGLQPYNPGPAPRAPKEPNFNNGALRGQALALGERYGLVSGPDDPAYKGDGSHAITSIATQIAAMPGATTDGQAQAFLRAYAASGGTPGMTGTDYMNPEINPVYQSQRAMYDAQLAQYEQDLANHEFANQQYQKYSADGPYSSQQITDKITNLPGYQAEFEQGVDAIQKAASSSGYIGSGRVLKELSSFGKNTLSKFYGQTLDRLSQLAGMGQQAATGMAGLSAGLGNNTASLYAQQGENMANSALAAAAARASAYTAANTDYRTIGGGGGGLSGVGETLGGIASLAKAFSSKRLKEDFKTISTAEILSSINQLDIEKWKYKGINTEHIGPYAEQFRELFNVGDGTTINMIDVVGVLLASVKELSHQVQSIKQQVSEGHDGY